MKKMLEKIVVRFGKQLCMLVGIVAAFSANSCRGFFYQPEEPEELAEFIGKR